MRCLCGCWTDKMIDMVVRGHFLFEFNRTSFKYLLTFYVWQIQSSWRKLCWRRMYTMCVYTWESGWWVSLFDWCKWCSSVWVHLASATDLSRSRQLSGKHKFILYHSKISSFCCSVRYMSICQYMYVCEIVCVFMSLEGASSSSYQMFYTVCGKHCGFGVRTFIIMVSMFVIMKICV